MRDLEDAYDDLDDFEFDDSCVGCCCKLAEKICCLIVCAVAFAFVVALGAAAGLGRAHRAAAHRPAAGRGDGGTL